MLTFDNFIHMMSVFSENASMDEKVRFAFKIYGTPLSPFPYCTIKLFPPPLPSKWWADFRWGSHISPVVGWCAGTDERMAWERSPTDMDGDGRISYRDLYDMVECILGKESTLPPESMHTIVTKVRPLPSCERGPLYLQ